MTYHASYEQADGFALRRFQVRVEDGSVVVTSHLGIIGERLHSLDPTAARWLSQRLVEAAEEMDRGEA